MEGQAKNPWLMIPSADYEAHMSSPNVRQLELLRTVLRDLLEEFQPRSLVVPGCATGNGFEHVRPEVTSRVTGIDINPEYLAVARGRYEARIPGLTLMCADIAEVELPPASADLVYAGLILEYVELRPTIEKFCRWLRPGGVLALVIQLGGPEENVTRTGYPAVQRLASVLRPVDPAVLEELAERNSLLLIRAARMEPVPGKVFVAALYRK